MGTNNILPKAQRNKAQRLFQPLKEQRNMRNLIFLFSEAQHNSAIAERDYRTKSKRKLTYAIKFKQHEEHLTF